MTPRSRCISSRCDIESISIESFFPRLPETLTDPGGFGEDSRNTLDVQNEGRVGSKSCFKFLHSNTNITEAYHGI